MNPSNSGEEAKRVNMVSAFGRGETLAIALQEGGFQVRILDFTPAFPEESARGFGPFPIVDHAYMPAQQEFLQEARLVPEGLVFWLKDGPLELTGPLSAFHVGRHPELLEWKATRPSRAGNSAKTNRKIADDFSRLWLERFLGQWSSPYYREPWETNSPETEFPADFPFGLFPANREQSLTGFERAEGRGIEVLKCHGLRDVMTRGQSLAEVEVDSKSPIASSARHWVWCLSANETTIAGKESARKLFRLGHPTPKWAWLSFEGHIQEGPWCGGLPHYVVVIGDVFLPWVYANAVVLRRLDATRCRFWLKVPRSRIENVDARRGWAEDLRQLLQSRLGSAEWSLDSAQWGLCPHSEVYASDDREFRAPKWKNWEWISPETLPRLDVSARLQREAETFKRLVEWKNERNKNQGATSDRTLHAP